MTGHILPSELILNARGAIYHLDLTPKELAPIILLVGDPARVALVSSLFDSIEYKGQHREFVTHTGRFHHLRISVISTGIGPDNIDIVLNEVDALANIDFATRSVKSNRISLYILRIGTSGAIQKHVPTDSFVVSSHGVALDNLMRFYTFSMNESERLLVHELHKQVNIPDGVSPYITSSSPRLERLFVNGFHRGMTLTAPGFYGPQGRVLRMGLSNPDLNQQFTNFRSGVHEIMNYEMETSAIYALSRALGHHCLSLSLIIANRIAGTFSNNPLMRMQILIETVLSQLLLWDE